MRTSKKTGKDITQYLCWCVQIAAMNYAKHQGRSDILLWEKRNTNAVVAGPLIHITWLIDSMNPVRVFVGFDQAEAVAYHTLVQSLIDNSSVPLWIMPLVRGHLATLKYTRPRGPLDSTDFSISRFMVPNICNYRGWAIFLDCDMLFRGDVAELIEQVDPRYAVMVKKHDHRPVEGRKFLGAEQTRYARKNWSSLMLFNCEQCTALTPEYINDAQGLDLHQFAWLRDEQIGSIAGAWNLLVGYDKYDPQAKLVHFTKGTPCFNDYRRQEYADEWERVYRKQMHKGMEWA